MRSAYVLSKPQPLGLSKCASTGLTARGGRGLLVTVKRRAVLARIGAMSFSVSVSSTADVATGKIVDSEVSSFQRAPQGSTRCQAHS